MRLYKLPNKDPKRYTTDVKTKRLMAHPCMCTPSCKKTRGYSHPELKLDIIAKTWEKYNIELMTATSQNKPHLMIHA